MKISERVYLVTKSIPKGKVLTYGRVAKIAGLTNPRLAGTILHKNPDPENISCYRVVNSRGQLAKKFAFGGLNGQAQKLKSEGVEVKNGKVDLTKYLWKTNFP